MENKRTLIIGGLGYIGSRLTEYLSDKDIDCRTYDAGFFRNCQLYDAVDRDTIIRDARNVIESDLNGIGTVIHLAGISNDPFGNLTPEQIYNPTREYAYQIALLCKERGIRFIFPSSCSVYGVGGSRELNEDSVVQPQTPYSANKLEVEHDLHALSDDNFSPIILRLATVYGMSPRMRFDLVVNMLSAMAYTTGNIILNSDGKAWRPHIHIDDVCEAIYQCIHLTNASNKPLLINVGSNSQNIRIVDVAHLVKSHVPDSQITFLQTQTTDDPKLSLVRDAKIQDGVDSRTYKVSFNRIKDLLPEYRPQWSLQTAIPKMLDHFKKIDLNETMLNDFRYYRLQTLAHLLDSGSISDDLRWR